MVNAFLKQVAASNISSWNSYFGSEGAIQTFLTVFKTDLDGGDFKFTSNSLLYGKVNLDAKTVTELGFDIEIYSVEILVGSNFEENVTKLGAPDVLRLETACLNSLQTILGSTIQFGSFYIT